MELSELLATAWSAVEKSGVPSDQRSVAFKEAISVLREDTRSGQTTSENGKPSASVKKQAASRPRSSVSSGSGSDPIDLPSEDEFFARLADESGVDETELRDILQLTASGDVHVTPATRKLGTSKKRQAQTIISLVAAARGYGLGESPVDGKKVLTEVQRKNCHDVANYSKHVTSLNGLNQGANRTLILTSKWVDDFKPAVNQALGRSGEDD